MKPDPEKTAVDAAAAVGDVAVMVAAETAAAVVADAAAVMVVAEAAVVAVAMIARLAGNQQSSSSFWSAAFFSCTPNKFNWAYFRKDAFVLW
jgi:uncharacterized cupin superfamily protein